MKSDDLGKARTTFERPDPKKPGAKAQIALAQELYRGYQNVLRAIASLHTPEADRWLDHQALRVASDFSGISAYVAATQLWDRADPLILAPGLEQEDPMRRDRAQWTLVKYGEPSATALRTVLRSHDTDARLRAAQSLAWIGDQSSRQLLQGLSESDPENRAMYQWCLQKLEEMRQIQQAQLQGVTN